MQFTSSRQVDDVGTDLSESSTKGLARGGMERYPRGCEYRLPSGSETSVRTRRRRDDSPAKQEMNFDIPKG